MELFYKRKHSVVGELVLVARNNALLAVIWLDDEEMPEKYRHATRKDDHPLLQQAEKQLDEYFAGQRIDFELPLSPEGTEYQLRIWSELRAIPYGKTWSYKQLAERTGNPKSARAAGGATGRNPLSIVIPCHRVVGTDGKLTGFGGGLDNKAILLDIERKNS